MNCTWGADSTDRDNFFKAKFTESYFLTDPANFVFSHFPYMNRHMDDYMTWQLLKQPLLLEQFTRLVSVTSTAFDIGIFPKSHKQGVFQFKDTEFMFQQDDMKENIFSPKL